MAAAVPLQPAPPAVRRVCAELQAGVAFPFLCPRQLPRATRGWHIGDSPPRLTAVVLGNPRRPSLATPYGLDVGYSAPVEPESGPAWRRLLWHNQPCCFLHFTLFVPHGARPPAFEPARLAGRTGAIRRATGYGLRRSRGYYWSNHTWFTWRAGGVRWVASLHYFGPGTTALLGRIIAGLRPVRSR